MADGRSREAWVRTSHVIWSAFQTNSEKFRGRSKGFKVSEFDPYKRGAAKPMSAKEVTETLGALMGVQKKEKSRG